MIICVIYLTTTNPRVERRKMKEYLLRLDESLYKRIEVEANSRGIPISEMMRELLEIALLEMLRKEYEKRKNIC